MTKNQRDSIVAVVMVSACLAAGIRAYQHSKKHATPAATVEAGATPVEAQLLEDTRFIGAVRATQTASEEQGGRWNQEWERDPFRAEEIVAGSSIENLALNGIFWEEASPRAIINGKTLKLGDLIDGYKLVEIQRSSVILWTGEKNLQLSVFRSPFYQDDDAGAPAEAAPEPEKTELPSETSGPASGQTPLPDIGLFKGLNKNLQTAKSFIGGTEGAENMAKMMGAPPSAAAGTAESAGSNDASKSAS